MAKGIAHREWVVSRSDYDTDAEFRQAVETEMVLNVQIMERLGVAVISAPVRRQSDEWYTEAVIFQTSTVPGLREPASPLTHVEVEGEMGGVPQPVEA